MKLLFAYFDFTKRNDRPTSFHLDKDYSLNFSTEYDFSVTRKVLQSDSGDTIQYFINQDNKLENEYIPKGFWGERIYNVTAIVGDNGSGKSTLLHSIIRSTLLGLNPDVPFLLVLQDTDSDKLRLYCSDRKAFFWKGQGILTPRDEYPKELKRAKCMLLDNTLSLSSYQLSNDYEKFIESEFDKEHKEWEELCHDSEKDPGPEPQPYQEWEKQLNNKSLLASIQFSNNMSAGSIQRTKPPVATVMFNHFSYESFQEVRFLYDEYYQDILDCLQKKYPVPRPGNIYVSVTPAPSLCSLYADIELTPNSIWSNLVHSYKIQGFVGKIMIDAMINLLCLTVVATEDNPIAYVNIEWLDRLRYIAKDDSIDVLGKAANQLIMELEWYLNDPPVPYIIWRDFFSFVVNECNTLQEIFQVSPSTPDSIGNAEYMINDEEITSDPKKRECLISFLDKYKKICEPRYFLTFHSGMSSGEKNLLRMLTQFRYTLKGPMFIDTVNKNVTFLKNRFFHKGIRKTRNKVYCDTLFLFLDEVDLTYHPEWQRIIVAMLNDVLPLVFHDPYVEEGGISGGCHNIQVILATHSPLILGDFPKASVIYLKKDDKENQAIPKSTFGENLYTILKDGFFMNDTLGSFAKGKIDETIKWCAAIREYCDQRDKPNGKPDFEKESILSQDYVKHFKTMQLLPPGIIQNKLILELNECAKRLPIFELREKLDEKRLDDHNSLVEQINRLQEKLDQAEKLIDKLKKEEQVNE